MKTQLPIYRAEIDTRIQEGEEAILHQANNKLYAIGYPKPDKYGNVYMSVFDEKLKDFFEFKIHKSTLAIHFPDMIDSEGTKIFASLSKDGKGGRGGSVCEDEANPEYSATVIFQQYKICFNAEMTRDGDFFELLSRGRLKVTGIEQ
jgi:hypothetical protein